MIRHVRTARELELERWWVDAAVWYILPWYRKPAWFVGWMLRGMP